MKDIRLLCVVLLIGGLMGAVLSKETDHINVRHPIGRGIVDIAALENGGVSIFMYTGKDAQEPGFKAASLCIVVDNSGSLLTMRDGKNRTRLGIGTSDKGDSFLYLLGPNGKPVWGAIADENGKVKTIGH